jgi:hypothetical protein
MLPFAHHMAVEILGREYSPQTPLEHACVFAALAFIVGTSLYGTYVLALKAREAMRVRAGL